MKNSEIFVTLDLDWLSDEYLEESIAILERFNVKATIFATHESPLIKGLDPLSYEIALHPNFDDGDGKIDLKALQRLHQIYPQAIGTRSHTLLFGSRFLPELHRYNIRYESNTFMYMHEGLHCTARTNSVTSIPFNWSDDKHIELGEEFDIARLPRLSNSGLNVFNFHPIHIYLNTEKPSRYEAAKSCFNTPGMSAFVNRSDGIGSLFKNLCKEISTNGLRSGVLRELVK